MRLLIQQPNSNHMRVRIKNHKQGPKLGKFILVLPYLLCWRAPRSVGLSHLLTAVTNDSSTYTNVRVTTVGYPGHHCCFARMLPAVVG